MIGQDVSHYRILSRLGAGGMGVVYEAEDTRLGRKVALKFLPEEANSDADSIQRFQREARVISNLNHPYICTLYDIGVHQGRQFMVMELLDGQPLKDRIAKGALTVEEVIELGAQMADALDAAHSQGIVHRDIKPANLFVTRRGSIKVLDFGVAKLSESGRSDLDATIAGTDQLTSMGTTIGTVSYMSPEQARGQEIDARSDLFSAGVVLYEMACGKLPFPGVTTATIFEGLLTKAPVPPSQVRADLPAELDRIVLKALEKDRDTRYQGAAELRADLKRLKRSAESGSIAATVTAQVKPAPSKSRAGWRMPLFVGAPLVTAALVVGLFLYRSQATPALTQQDSVVLASIVNRTGDTMFDDTLGDYSQGLRTRRTTGDFDSVPFFRRAIELDPEFALAYARLGTVYSNLGQVDEAKKMTTRAFELRAKVSELERYYVEARYFTTVENDVTKALDTYKVWLATYPNDYTALTNSALLNKQQGDRAEAVRKLELATKVAPDQPLAWSNLSQTYFELGQYAEARRASESAIKIQDSTSARISLYQVAVFMGDDALAEEQVAAVRGRRDEVDMVPCACLPPPIAAA